MGIYAVKSKFQKFLKPFESFLIKHKIHPTTINIAALILSILCGICLYFADWNIYLLLYVPFMVFFRTALNALDGMVARTLKVGSQEFGEVLNEFFDRLADASIFSGLALAQYTNLVLGSITTILILLNSYLSIVSKAAGGKRQYGGFMGKADRMIYLGIISVTMFIIKNLSITDYFLLFVSFGTLITIIQRFVSIKDELYN